MTRQHPGITLLDHSNPPEIGILTDKSASPMVSVTRRGTVSMDEMLRIQAVFAGSAVSSLSIRVNDYAALLDPVRDQYYGRLADVLDVRVGD